MNKLIVSIFLIFILVSVIFAFEMGVASDIGTKLKFFPTLKDSEVINISEKSSISVNRLYEQTFNLEPSKEEEKINLKSLKSF